MDTRNRTPTGSLLVQCADEEACTVFSCAVCLKDVPADTVKLKDAQDYVHHFCGLDCLGVWQKQSALANKPV